MLQFKFLSSSINCYYNTKLYIKLHFLGKKNYFFFTIMRLMYFRSSEDAAVPTSATISFRN
jgi:hypothetical protein